MKNILILIFVAIGIFLSVLLIRKLINTNSETDPEIPTTENTTPGNVVVTPSTNIIFDGYTPHTEYINYKFEIY